jgi:superoxide reductase
MAKLLGIYQCQVCGNMVEVIKDGGGTLSCCGQEMKLLTENSTDAAKEKHVPVIEKKDNGYLVKVGSVAHPMEEKHSIQWIELLADGIAYRQFLKPGGKPESLFCINAAVVSAREFCNLHGVWKSA